MSSFNQRIKRLVECTCGWDVERLSAKSLALVGNKHRKSAWFSHTLQIRSILDTCGIDLLIDVGANEGQFGRQIRSYYRGEVLSFEPVEAVFQKLKRAAADDPKWHVHQLALGSKDSTETINVTEKTTFSSLLSTNEFCAKRFGSDAVKSRKEIITVRRLDDVLDETVPDIAKRRVFLKLDTQGYDLEVFKGLTNRLDTVVALQSEVSLVPLYEGMPHWTESIATYERGGFAVVGMYPVTRDSYRVIEFDCLLIRAGM